MDYIGFNMREANRNAEMGDILLFFNKILLNFDKSVRENCKEKGAK